MIAAVALAWAAYIALGIYSARRAWLAGRGLPAWARRLGACVVVAVFFAPSLIPAGHGVGVGPALVAGAIWHEGDEILKFMLLPIAVTAAAAFVLASFVSVFRGRTSPAPAAPELPVGRAEAIATALVLLSPVAGFAGLHAAQEVALRNERESREAQYRASSRAEADARATGTWRSGSAGGPPVLYLSHEAVAGSGAMLARAPASGEVVVIASPGALPPGTPVMVRDGAGKMIGSATTDANGGFELRVSAKRDDYLRVVPVEIRRAPTNAIRATQVVDAPEPLSPKP